MNHEVDVLIAPSSFGECGEEPFDLLKRSGIRYFLNPYKRKLSETELISLGSSCLGIIAGLEIYSAAVLDACPKLKCISRCGIGLDSIDLPEAGKRGISIVNTPDAPTEAVAELTVGLIFALLRGISVCDANVKAGKWIKFFGSLVHQKKVGIIGYGRIGKRVAQLLQSFSPRIFIYDPKIPSLPDEAGIESVTLDFLLKESDIVTLHLSWENAQMHLLGSYELSLLKKGAFLINVARGGVIDESVLYDKLEKHELGGAALDVFSQEPYVGELTKLDNIILTPHIGSYARESRLQMEVASVRNLIKILCGQDSN